MSTVILGAGMAGLGAATASGAPVYEASSHPGGLCHSVYRGDPSDPFRFEPAGGHWLFDPTGADLARLSPYATFRRYERRAAVFFANDGRTVPFPLQEHLYAVDPAVRARALAEMDEARRAPPAAPATWRDWLLLHFGSTLGELFFLPFNERYTAGLFNTLAPQDTYKSPVNWERVLAGSRSAPPASGYNTTFHYPEGGLDALSSAIASRCTVKLGRRVVAIDTTGGQVHFADGGVVRATRVLSTLPLHAAVEMCGLSLVESPDPSTAVLVVNLGAVKGPRCPSSHWLYLPTANSGIHRIGFYSNVDADFLPVRRRKELVSLYAELAFPTGTALDRDAIDSHVRAIVQELRDWGFIGDVLAVEASLTDPAYTWARPGSTWATSARGALVERCVHPFGRFGGWRFQGMAASFAEGCRIGGLAST